MATQERAFSVDAASLLSALPCVADLGQPHFPLGARLSRSFFLSMLSFDRSGVCTRSEEFVPLKNIIQAAHLFVFMPLLVCNGCVS